MTEGKRAADVLTQVHALFDAGGGERYFGEAISQRAHALQSAALATAEGAPPDLVVAALLHDIGHLLHRQGETAAGRGLDMRHEELGAKWILPRLGEKAAEPVRLHVHAKRYLCWRESGYRAGLSAASEESLVLQGGPMKGEEAQQFEQLSFAQEALQLRRWDEAAKVVGLAVPELAAYDGMVLALAERALASGGGG